MSVLISALPSVSILTSLGFHNFVIINDALIVSNNTVHIALELLDGIGTAQGSWKLSSGGVTEEA